MRSGRRIAYILALLLALALLSLSLAQCAEARRRAQSEQAYFALACAAARDFDVPPGLVLAVIRTESDFCADAVSSAGAKGLMQLMPDTFAFLRDERMHEKFEDNAIFDPAVNIRYGTYYLAYLYERFENWPTVLAAYNAGESRVAEWLGSSAYSKDGKTLFAIPFPETERYVERAMEHYHDYNEKYRF